MKERRYAYLGDPLLHLMLIAALVATLAAWQSSGRRSPKVIGPEVRVISLPTISSPVGHSGSAEASEPTATL